MTATNCYFTALTDPDEFWATRLDSDDWDDATDDQKAKALITATKMVDRQTYTGLKVDEDQAHAFPRYWRDFDGSSAAFREVLETIAEQSEVPQAVKDAVCVQAAWLLGETTWDRQRKRNQSHGVADVSLGRSSESYTPGASYRARNHDELAPEAMVYLAPFIANVGTLV
jgi:hypothetical protein